MKVKPALTIEDLIYCVLKWSPGCQVMTAAMLHNKLTVMGFKVKLGSLSSQLAKMVAHRKIDKTTNFGPRGGNAYSLPKEKA